MTVVAIGVAASAAGQKPTINVSRGVAIRGYDAVGYFSEGRPLKGRAEFEYRWRAATWRFASAGHRDAFAREPERYAPQFGGYCAYAVGNGYTADSAVLGQGRECAQDFHDCPRPAN